jgi:hypothetical protein
MRTVSDVGGQELPQMIDGGSASASQLLKTELYSDYRRLRFQHLPRGKNVAAENNVGGSFSVSDIFGTLLVPPGKVFNGRFEPSDAVQVLRHLQASIVIVLDAYTVLVAPTETDPVNAPRAHGATIHGAVFRDYRW